MTVVNPPHAGGGGLTKAEVEAIATAAAAGKITAAEALKLTEEALAKTEAKESPLVKATTANTALSLTTYSIFPVKLEHDTVLEFENVPALTSIEVRVKLEGHKLTGIKIKGGASVIWIPGPEPTFEGEAWISLIVTGAGTELLGLTGSQGPKGAEGPKGAAGANGANGIPSEWKGEWVKGTTYTVGQGVSYKGASYVCIKEGKEKEPPNAEYWGVLAEKGAEGGAGELEWHEVESLNAKVESYPTEVEGEHYAPIRYAIGPNGQIYLSGMLKVKETLAAGSVLFKLPEAARPAFRRVINVVNVESVGGTFLTILIRANGEVKNLAEWATSRLPGFSGVTFSKAH